MKKIIAILLLIASLLTVTACKKDEEYPPVESTEEEARTVMTLSIDGKSYDVRYELYRAFFLTYKSSVDGGNIDVWSGENADEYIAKIDEMIVGRIVEIYAAFALCERIGFDLYSDDVEDKIEENIRISVEGGSYGSATIEGYDSYDDYLAALKAINLNYSVQTLLFRYAIAIDAIDTYYIGTASSDDVDINLSKGAIEYTKEDIKEFYDSDECVRVLRTSVQKAYHDDPLGKAEKLKSLLTEAASSKTGYEDKELAVVNTIMGNGLYSDAAEIKNGYIIGRHNLERSYYGEMTDAAFSLSECEVSDPIEVVTNEENAYYILYKTYKNDSHFEENYESIRYIYLMNYVGEIIHGVEDQLKASVTYTDILKNIDHSQIGM